MEKNGTTKLANLLSKLYAISKPKNENLAWQKTGNDKLLTTKSDNILTAWKFLLLIYQFTSNVSCLIDLITTEKKIVQITNYCYK